MGGSRSNLVRAAFCVAWVVAQFVLIVTAGRRADGAFGFRMFNESTTITIHLSREVRIGDARAMVPVVDEEWVARDGHGVPYRFAWTERVVDPVLSHLDVTMHAAYGQAAQLERLQAALDDVASHIPDDAETCALEASVTVQRNGHDAEDVVLRSAPRSVCGDAK